LSKPLPASEGRRSNLIAVLLFLALIALFYQKVIFGNYIFVFVDASRFFYPLWKWGGEALKGGIIPLWNPDAQFGTPYLADPQMAYAYPPVPVLYSFLSPLNAFAWLIILHHLWALLGFWFFARGQGFSGKASFFGSLTFGFSLHVVCSSWTPVALLTISWVPWVFWALEKILRNERGGFFCLSFVWAMQLAAGYPVLAYLTGLAVGFEVIWKLFKSSTENPLEKKTIGKIALASLSAVAYNLVWGLPFAEFLGQSNYQNGASRYHDLNFLDLATSLAPFDQGHPLGVDYHGPHYWVSTYFFGRPALCLLLWGAFARLFRKSSWGVFPLLLILSLGGTLGLSTLLKAFLPGYSLVIHSGFWLSLLLLWAAWMAVETAEDFLGRDKTVRQIVGWVFLVSAIFGVTFLFKKPLPLGAFTLSYVCLVLAGVVPSIRARWGLLMAALVFSLGSAATSLNILLDRSYYEAPPKVLSKLNQEGRLFFSPPVMRSAAVLHGANMPEAYEAAKQKLYPDWPLACGREEAPLYNTLQLKHSFAWAFQAFGYSLGHSRKALDYLDIRYVFGKAQFKGFKPIAWDGPIEVSENPTACPKWFTVERSFAAGKNLEDDFALANRSSMDYRKECFIEDGFNEEKYQNRKVQAFPVSPNQLRVEAKGEGKALLISSETDYPGWKAFVGKEERQVELINHAFRGVVMNSGEEEVHFYFVPLTFRIGLFLSMLITALWCGLFLGRVRV